VLSLGFGVQIVGYVLTLAHEPTVAGSWCRAFVALGLGIIVAGAAWVVAAQLSDWATKRTLVSMASYRIKRADEPPQRVLYPFVPPLLDWGKASGWPPRPDEDAEAYARRVFRVDRITPGGPNDDPPADAPSV
jgi:hypothetical protein